MNIAPCQVAVIEYLRQQSPSDVFIAMRRDYCGPTIRMAQKMMAALYSYGLKTKAVKYVNKFSPCVCRENTHIVTMTR